MYITVEIRGDCMSKMTIDSNGDKRWHNARGEFHRIDGPAIERVDGHKEWWVDGKLHKLDGPAIEWDDGDYWWHINGKRYSNFKDFQAAGRLTDDQMCVIRLKYGEIGG